MGPSLMECLPSFLDELAPLTKLGAPVTPGVISTVAKTILNPVGRTGRLLRRVAIGGISGPGGLQELGRRVDKGPAYVLSEGWRQIGRSSRLRPMQTDPGFIKNLTEKYKWKGDIPAVMTRAEQIGLRSQAAQQAGMKIPSRSHLAEHATAPLPVKDILQGKVEGKNRIKALFEELSRSGWTGEGDITKYLPVGPKGMMGGFVAGYDIPSIVSDEPGPEGEGRLAKTLKTVGGLGGMIAGGGLGFLPGMGLYMGGASGGAALGRKLEQWGGMTPQVTE